MRKYFLTSLLLSLSLPVFAGWDVKGVYVKKVDQFASGNTVITRFIYEVDGGSVLPPFQCAPNNNPVPGYTNRYQASYWGSGVNGMHQIMIGQLLSAQAQDFKVDIYFDPSGCDQNSAWGYSGLGRKVHGLSVISD